MTFGVQQVIAIVRMRPLCGRTSYICQAAEAPIRTVPAISADPVPRQPVWLAPAPRRLDVRCIGAAPRFCQRRFRKIVAESLKGLRHKALRTHFWSSQARRHLPAPSSPPRQTGRQRPFLTNWHRSRRTAHRSVTRSLSCSARTPPLLTDPMKRGRAYSL